MQELKKRIEAILFSVGKYISIEEIAKLCGKEVQEVKEVLRELQVDYENDNSSLVVLNEGEMWKLTTREEYSHIVRKIVSETELTKTQIETLAVIAFKYPIKQSDLIKIRTNKAYDHLSELERLGFITRKKYGRSKLIKLTDKFFEYFDLPREKLKEQFKGFEQLANTIENKEDKIEKAKEEQRKLAEEAKKQEEQERKLMNGQIEVVDMEEDKAKKEKLEVFEEPEEQSKVEEFKERLGQLEVVDEDTEEEANEKETKQEESIEKSIDEVLNVENNNETQEEENEEEKEPDVEAEDMKEEETEDLEQKEKE